MHREKEKKSGFFIRGVESPHRKLMHARKKNELCLASK